jgi:hypothetical protein
MSEKTWPAGGFFYSITEKPRADERSKFDLQRSVAGALLLLCDGKVKKIPKLVRRNKSWYPLSTRAI